METRVRIIDQRLQRLQALMQRLRAERRVAILRERHCNLKAPRSKADSHGPLRPSRDEFAAQQATKNKIAAKYGFTDWNEAPDGALQEYCQFLKTRTKAKE